MNGAPDNDIQNSVPTDLDRLPDLPSAVNNPIFQKLVLITGIIFRRGNPGMVDPHSLNNEELLLHTKSESFVYSTSLVEFVQRVAKGVIPVEEMEANFSEQTIKTDIMDALNVLVDMGDLRISKEEGSDSGTGERPVMNYECPVLEQIIQDIIDNRLLSEDEIRISIRNAELHEFFSQKFIKKEDFKPTFISRYYERERHGEKEKIERAHTLLEFSSIAAEIENEQIASEKGKVPTGVSGKADDIDISFTDEESPTIRRRISLPSAPALIPPTASEAAELEEKVKVPGAIAEVTIDGEQNFRPILFEGEMCTIGSDPINDFVVSGNYANKTEPEHGKIFAKGGVIHIGAISAFLKLEKEYYEQDENGNMEKREYPGGNNIVFKGPEKPVARGQVFYLMPLNGAFNDTTDVPCFSTKADYEFSKKEIQDELKSRFIRFTELKADKLFQSLHEKDEKKTKILRQEALAIEKKLEKLDEAAQKYGITMMSADERERINLEATFALGSLLNNTIEGYFKNIARFLLQFVEENCPNIYAGSISEAFIRNNEKCGPAIKQIEGLFHFANEFGIQLMPMERAQSLMIQVMAKAESSRLEIVAKIEKEREKNSRVNEENMKRMHERAEKRRGIESQYAGVHLGEGEVLDENTKFEYVGPVIKITDGHIFTRIDPFLIDKITIGHHSANTHRVPRLDTPKRKTSDFMADIEKDGDEFLLTWLKGTINFTGAVMTSPTLKIDPGMVFSLSTYRVTLEDNHAYTMQALKQICPSFAKELLEVFFNMNETTTEQNESALMNLETLVEKGFVEMRFVEEIIEYGLSAMCANISDWNTARPTTIPKENEDIPEEAIGGEPMAMEGVMEGLYQFINAEMDKKVLQDANYLRDLKLLLDISGKTGFLKKVKTAQLRALLDMQVKKRTVAYCAMEKERKNMIDEEQSTYSMRKVTNFFSENSKKERQEQLRALEFKSALGAIQIARFHEMGLIDLEKDVTHIPGASAEYLANIREIHIVRGLLQKFESGKISNEEIAELRQKSAGMKLSSVLSSDEIENADHNIEVDLSHEVTLEYYVSKLAVMVGGKKLRKATAAEDPRRYISIISQLKNCGLLKDTDLMQLPEMPVENVTIILAELSANAHYLNEQDQLKIEQGWEVRREIIDLKKAAFEVDKLITRAAKESDLEMLLSGAGHIADNVLALRMARLGVTMPAFEKIEDISEEEMKAIKFIAQINYDRTWEVIRSEYRQLALELCRIEVKKILACDDPDYRMTMVGLAVRKGLFTYEEIGMTAEQMQAGVDGTRALTKARILDAKKKELREKYAAVAKTYTDELDNIDYLKEIKAGKIADEDEREIAVEMVAELNKSKMAQILENIGRDEDAGYMKMLAKGIMLSGYAPALNFSPEEMAKLG